MSAKVVCAVNDIGIGSLPQPLKNKRYRCGELIVKASPFVHIISNKSKGQYCDWCALPPKNNKLLRCSVCQFNYYCDPSCQKRAWKFHKFECPIIRSNNPQIVTDSVRLLCKLLWKCSLKIEEQKPEHDPGWRTWNDLCDHSKLLQVDDRRSKSYLEASHQLFQYYGHANLEKHGLLANVDKILTYYGRLLFNTFTLTHMGNEVGAALYLSPSVLNHSCSPNAAHVCDKTTIYVRALKDIDTSEEPIFINYIDPMQPLATRQHELWENYYFHCHCYKCVDINQEGLLEATVCPKCEGDVVKRYDDTLLCSHCDQEISDPLYIDMCERATQQAMNLCDEKLMKSNPDVKQIQQFVESNHLLSEKNVNLSVAKCTLYAHLSKMGNEEQAFRLGEEITELLKLYYPEVYPAHSVHQLKQARLAWNCEKYDIAILHYRKAFEIMCLSHGPEHHLTQLVKSDIVESENFLLYSSKK
ncbi:Bzd [Bugula neritina]|uniref:Bzd n=1 Tax=Bugula neritina TaxID=10212 RepID=A0A7J7J2I3_BUGNE|nr:Bzd [Bugula neritina]